MPGPTTLFFDGVIMKLALTLALLLSSGTAFAHHFPGYSHPVSAACTQRGLKTCYYTYGYWKMIGFAQFASPLCAKDEAIAFEVASKKHPKSFIFGTTCVE
jgi:hypothetical protein